MVCARSMSTVRATNEASAPRARLTGLKGEVDRARGTRLGALARLRGRRVLTLGEAVDLVVEQQDLEVDVAAQRMDQVVATDRHGVTVTADDPDRQLGACHRQPGSDCGARPWMPCKPYVFM